MTEPWDVVVVGSCMIDLICYSPRLPKGGETLRGSDFSIGFGGKGCNQCVAAKKLGARSLLVARVGDDSFGRDYVKHLEELNIPTNRVRLTKGLSSGMAQITVADDGENQIVVVPGANNLVCEKDVMEAEADIINCRVLICQMEINEESTLRALELKAQGGIGKSIFNGAPAIPDLNAKLYSLPDVFCVNETEAETFSGVKIKDLQDARRSLGELLRKGCREVIITLGEEGALYGSRRNPEGTHVPAEKVAPVDTTGAGDAFIGALGFFTARYPGLSMEERIKHSCAAAAISVLRKGTQESFPNISELKLDMMKT